MNFKLETEALLQIATHLPTGIKFRFTPTDVLPQHLKAGQVILYDDLSDMWIGETIEGEHDEVIMQAAWEAVNRKFWDESKKSE